jgi:hypothetical protein
MNNYTTTGQQLTITLPSPSVGQTITINNVSGTSVKILPPMPSNEEMIFIHWMDNRNDIELVEQFMKQEIFQEISLAQFEKLCQRFRPTLTPEVIQKIIKLKVFL